MKVIRYMLVALFALAGGALVMAQDDLPALADLPVDEWTVIEPGGDTLCSNGTPFSYFVRPNSAESDNLMVYFQGGGACWFGDICNLAVNPTYDPFVDETDTPPASGIMDFANEENPFADYSVVFVPYCTADVHIGSSDTTYTDSAGDEVTIFHRGYENSTTVLDWTFANFEAPETVFVTGSSAGSIPAPFYAEFVAEAYPEARIEVLGDAAGGYRLLERGISTLESWGTYDILTDLYADYNKEDNILTFESFYIEVGEEYPDISMTQYNAAGDDVQIGFLALNGIFVDAEGLGEILEQQFDDIEARIDNFNYFTAGGEVHTILLLPQFYEYAVDGVRFVDWVTDLANGEDVETLACSDCAEPETVMGE
jgi:hypothetical protein